MSGRPYETAHLDELERLPSFQGVTWLPVRRRFGIEAFGANAYAGERGELVIEEHGELGLGGSGTQEELYFVAAGRAAFTVAGEDLEAPRGTFVFVRDPAAKRKAVAEEPGTVVLVFGGTRGEAYRTSPWEWIARSIGPQGTGDLDAARAVLEEGLAENPDHPTILYNLACYEALAGDRENALQHLGRAVELHPRAREWARTDEDFDSVRDDPGFQSAIAGEPEAGNSPA